MAISLSKDQMMLSVARRSLSQLVDDIDAGVKPGVSIIKDGQSKVVMISTETYEQLLIDREQLLEALNTATQLDKGLADYKAGKTKMEERFFAVFDKKYGRA